MFLFAALGLAQPRAHAIPPEGFEAYRLLTEGKESPRVLYVQAGYVNPAWISDYQTIQAYASAPVFGTDYFSYGASFSPSTVGNRDAYFIRYDHTFWGQSFSLKFAHVDYWYVGSAKNTFSFDYNLEFRLGAEAQFYFVAGIYSRYTLNQWNSPTWSPFNFNTENREFFLEAVFGTKLFLGSKVDFVTMDINNRDPFISYNGDDISFDASFNFVSSATLTWRLTNSARFSGILAGTADFAEDTVLAGIVTKF